MTHMEQRSTADPIVLPLPEETDAASDQRSFGESLRAGIRSLGELVRNRKKKPSTNPTPLMASDFRSEVDRLLREGGWYPGRQVPELMEQWRAGLTTERFVLHLAAEAVLLEFGGLHVGRVEPGIDLSRSDVWLDPERAMGEEDRCYDCFPEMHGRVLFPLGDAHRSQAYVVIDQTGECFLLMDEIYARWPSFHLALEALLLGLPR